MFPKIALKTKLILVLLSPISVFLDCHVPRPNWSVVGSFGPINGCLIHWLGIKRGGRRRAVSHKVEKEKKGEPCLHTVFFLKMSFQMLAFLLIAQRVYYSHIHLYIIPLKGRRRQFHSWYVCYGEDFCEWQEGLIKKQQQQQLCSKPTVAKQARKEQEQTK